MMQRQPWRSRPSNQPSKAAAALCLGRGHSFSQSPSGPRKPQPQVQFSLEHLPAQENLKSCSHIGLVRCLSLLGVGAVRYAQMDRNIHGTAHDTSPP